MSPDDIGAVTVTRLHAGRTVKVIPDWRRQGEDGGCVVCSPNYDFNDDAFVLGGYWAVLAGRELGR